MKQNSNECSKNCNQRVPTIACPNIEEKITFEQLEVLLGKENAAAVKTSVELIKKVKCLPDASFSIVTDTSALISLALGSIIELISRNFMLSFLTIS